MSKKQIAISCFLFALFIVSICAARYDFDFSTFVAAPQSLVKCVPEKFKHIKHFKQGGSDGAYNYLAALDPLLRTHKALPACAKDSLSYTKERFLYHFLSWAIVFGQEAYVHYGLLTVNLLALLVCTFYSYRISELFQLSRYILVILILNPGIWQPLRFNLVDLVWDACAIACIYYYETKNKTKFSIALLGAFLVRSFSIGLVFAFVVGDLLAGKRQFKDYRHYLVPLGLYYGVFKYWQKLHATTSSTLFNGESYFELPFKQFYIEFMGFLHSGLNLNAFLALSGLLLLISMALIAVLVVLKTKKMHYEVILILGFTTPVLMLNNVAWSNAILQISRISVPTFFCLILLLKKQAQSYLRVVIPILYLVSFYGIVWIIFNPQQTLTFWITK